MMIIKAVEEKKMMDQKTIGTERPIKNKNGTIDFMIENSNISCSNFRTAGESSSPAVPFLSEKPALVMAPMAEITHAAFRHLAAEYGGWDLYYTEMLSAAALMNASLFEKHYLDFTPDPEKTIVQLVGNQEERFLQSLDKLKDYPVLGFDINMGCSAPPIRKKGWGVELMRDLEGTAGLIGKLRKALPDKSLSVKLRLGEKEDPEKLLAFCQAMADAGVDYLTLNPKIRKDGRNRPGRWEHVGMLSRELSIPILGSGDVVSYESYAYRMKVAAPAGVMLGRGAVAKPWLAAFIKGRRDEPDFKLDLDLATCANRFIELLKTHQPQEFWLSRSRRFFFYFTENFKFNHKLRYAIQNAPDLVTVETLMSDYFKGHPEERFQVAK